MLLPQLPPHSLDHRALPRVGNLLLPVVGRQLKRGKGRGEDEEHRDVAFSRCATMVLAQHGARGARRWGDRKTWSLEGPLELRGPDNFKTLQLYVAGRTHVRDLPFYTRATSSHTTQPPRPVWHHTQRASAHTGGSGMLLVMLPAERWRSSLPAGGMLCAKKSSCSRSTEFSRACTSASCAPPAPGRGVHRPAPLAAAAAAASSAAWPPAAAAASACSPCAGRPRRRAARPPRRFRARARA